MRRIILMLAFLGITSSALGQGKILFANDSLHLFNLASTLPADSGVGGPIPASPLPSGLTLIVSLYAGTSANNLSLQTSYSLTGSDWLSPGRMSGKTVILDISGGVQQFFQIVITDNTGVRPASIDPDTANAATFGGSYWGTSGRFTAVPGTGISYPFIYQPTAPVNSTWVGSIQINALVGVPSFSLHPSSQSATVGSNVTLNATAQGGLPFGYQWRKDGINISGATNNTLAFTNLVLSDAGNYDVVATNANGSSTSSNAVLQVLPWNGPSIAVNGNLAVGNVIAGAPAGITMTGGFPGGFVFYTLDGSTPTTSSTLYSGQFSIASSATIRAMSLSADFTQSAESPAVNVTIPPSYSLATSVSGSGAINLNPPAGVYLSNSVVTLTAVASANWVFDHWTGDLAGSSNPTNITMNGPRSVEAVFVPTAFPLTLSTPGGGSVTANGQTIAANTYYPTGSVVQLQATPNSGWTFLNWQGSATSAANPFGLVMNQTQNVQAIFGTVVITNLGGSGSVVMSATNPVPYGTVLTNTAVPAQGYRFVAWSGSVGGTNNPVTLTVTNATPTVGALFTPLPVAQLKNPRKVGPAFVCDLEGSASRSYQILYSTNLVTWSDLFIVTNLTGTVSFTNTMDDGRRYYRAMLLPLP